MGRIERTEIIPRMMEGNPNRSPWVWAPSLYFFQALPFFLVTTVSAVLGKHYGISNATIALAGSAFYLPWVIKPFGGPLVEFKWTKRGWIWITQLVLGALCLVVAALTSAEYFVRWAALLFLIIAIVATLHDIAAEGMYLLGLTDDQQSLFIGVRATFFRMGWLAMQGGFVAWIGVLLERGIVVPEAWRIGMTGCGFFFLGVGLLHAWSLPRPSGDRPVTDASNPPKYLHVFREYLRKPGIERILAYILVYRLGESQLQKLSIPFFMDPIERGGLGLSTKQVGLLYGTLGPFSLTIGGLLGGWVLARKGGLRRWLVPMAVALNVPHGLYWLLAAFRLSEPWMVGTTVVIEQFFYGFGFASFLIFLVQTSRGTYGTATYAIGTGLMSLGMMLPGTWSGWLEQKIGYAAFFGWVFACGVPSVWVSIRARRILR